MRKFSIIFILATAALALASQKTASKSHPTTAHKTTATANASDQGDVKLPSEDEVNGFMHETFGYDPQLTWKVLSIKPAEAAGLAEVTVEISGPQGQGSQRFFVTEDGKHAVVGDVIPFGRHPFEPARLELQKRVNGPARGPANAAVMVVEFGDLQCPHCKEANPTVEKLVNENPNIRYVFQNFPLPAHNWAEKAAKYADCVGRASNDAFWKFVDGVYAAQEQITADNADQKLTAIADSSGVKGSDITACSTTADAEARVQSSIELGKSVGVNSTPTLYVNGRPVGVSNNNYDALKQLVDFAATEKTQAPSNAAGK